MARMEAELTEMREIVRLQEEKELEERMKSISDADLNNSDANLKQ
jgi:hypothetical protein